MTRPKIKGGQMSINKARQRRDACREAIRSGDLAAAADAWSRLEGLLDTVFYYWNEEWTKEGE